MSAEKKRSRIGFVIEYSLGHVTHAKNLRKWIEQDGGVDARWMLVPYEADDRIERLPGVPFSLRLSLRAKALLRSNSGESFDGLYFHTQALPLFSLGLLKTVPTVISLDATPENFKSIARAYEVTPATGLIDRIKSRWFRIAFARAAGLVAFSDWVKESLVRDYGVDAEKIRVIRSGVDIEQWPPIDRTPDPSRPLRLLFVGGDFARKGGHVLLQAFRDGLAGLCELDIVTLDETIRPEPSVRVHTGLTPNAPALKALYANADLFLMPSEGDATPFAILEAMACSLPVMTTDVGALGELVRDGVTGFLVPQNDPQAIIDGVRELALDRSKVARMGAAGRLAVEREFDAQANYKKLIAFIKEVVGASGANPL